MLLGYLLVTRVTSVHPVHVCILRVLTRARAGALADAASGPPIVDSGYISHWIHLRYQACGFMRYLSDSDMKARAGSWSRVLYGQGLFTPCSIPRHALTWLHVAEEVA